MIRRLGFIANLDKPDVLEVTRQARDLADAEGIEVIVETVLGDALGNGAEPSNLKLSLPRSTSC